MEFKEITPEELNGNPFSMIGKDWMLVSAGNSEHNCNAMTASWGGMGVMWRKNVVFVVIRPQRCTKEFMDREARFSLSFFGGEQRKALSWMGSVSRHQVRDKVAQSGLTPFMVDGTPCFREARTIMICRKLFAQPYDPACFLDASIDPEWYSEKDYHTLYIAEIEKVLTR